jgi:hypothetical protein
MQINEHIIKVSGKANLPNELSMDQDVTLVLHGSVVKIEQESNQDGTVNQIYKVKVATAEIK